LGRSIEEREVLRGIDLKIEPGETVAVLGANGAGKSTLLRILGTLLTPSSGQLALFGIDIKHAGPALRGRIGLIGHQTMLYPDLSALENLEFFGRLYGVADAHARGWQLLEDLGLAARAEDHVKNFSRGMTQRVAIARGLIHTPELVLADEPFAGLDVEATRVVEKVLKKVAAAGGTVVMTNHDLPQSLALADRVVVLARGHKVMDAATGVVDVERVMEAMALPPHAIVSGGAT
jgi:heme ABC exporter ATP-binding subunit CcmA